jgi:hypothetical protein
MNLLADTDKCEIMKADLSCFSVGSDISRFDLDPNNNQKMFIGPSQISPYIIILSNSCFYNIAFMNKTVKAIFVNNDYPIIMKKKFETPEGVSIGMEYKKLIELIPGLKLTKINGWAYTAVLHSGWKVGFTIGITGTDDIPTSENKVTMIYMD